MKNPGLRGLALPPITRDRAAVRRRATERGPSAPVPSIVHENWAGVDMMYHLDGRWRCQSLMYFGEPQDSDLAYRHTRNPYIYIYVYVHINIYSIHVYRPGRMAFENRPLRLTPE